MEEKCPGRDKRNLKVETVICSGCGYRAEMFSDEMKIKCPRCKGVILRDKLPSCMDWCRAAGECRGDKVRERGKTK